MPLWVPTRRPARPLWKLTGDASGGASLYAQPLGNVVITGLSASHTAIGAQLTITGSGFGSSRGTSQVFFGDLPSYTFSDGYVLRCVSEEAASYVSWSDAQIVVTVPSMSPGKAGAPYTYHPVYVEVGGVYSNQADFYIDPVTTYTGQTFTTSSTLGYLMQNQTNVLYDGCTFTATSPNINGQESGVLNMRGTLYNITLNDCVVSNNTGIGTDGGVNAVKITDAAPLHDITFASVTFGSTSNGSMAFSRMGIEAVEADTWAIVPPGYVKGIHNIAVRGCTFEPCGGEPLSWSMPRDTYEHNILIEDTVIKGFGVGTAWQNCLENYGNNYCYKNVQVWAGWGSVFNMEGAPGQPTHCYFYRCDADFTHHYCAGQGGVYGQNDMLPLQGMVGAVFDQCDFNLGTLSSERCARVAQDGRYWGESHNNDLSTSYMHGTTSEQQNPVVDTIDYWRMWDGVNPRVKYGYVVATRTDANGNKYPILGTRP